MDRFEGTCETLCEVDRSALDHLIDWISAIPFKEWPQQHPVDAQLRPAMITDLTWHGFGERIQPLVWELRKEIGAERSWHHILSVVMPGHFIPPHKDEQGAEWFCRVHVPLVTNEHAFLLMDKVFNLLVGSAYKFNTMATHGIANMGTTPRIHLMFDVG